MRTTHPAGHERRPHEADTPGQRDRVGPTTAGTYQVTVTATDSGGGSGRTTFAYTVYGF
jgi:hypothetical protein